MTEEAEMPSSPMAIEARLVLGYAFLALRPNGRPPKLSVSDTSPIPIDGWDDRSLSHVIEEGRREVDRAVSDVDRFRTRGQVVFTTALALLGISIAGLEQVINQGGLCAFIVWAISVGVGGLSAAASFGASFGRTDLTQIRLDQLHPAPGGRSGGVPPDRLSVEWLAEGYLEASQQNHVSVSTLVTVVRDSVFLLALSALLYGGLWVVLTISAN